MNVGYYILRLQLRTLTTIIVLLGSRGIHQTNTLTSRLVNLHGTELALASSVAVLAKTVLLLSGTVLLCRNDTSVLIEQKLRPGKIARGLVRGSVPYLRPGTLQHFVFLSVHVVITIITSVASLHHYSKVAVILKR